jgi:ABC-type transport system substrate-binding protein
VRRGALASAGLVLVLLLASGGKAPAFLPPPYGGTLTVPLPDGPVTLDPARATRESELQLAALLYDPLFRLGPGGQPQPHLVLPHPAVADAGRTLRLQLRPGVRLQSGRVLAAADVVASLRRLRGGPNAHLIACVSSLEAESPQTVVLHLARSAPDLPLLLSAPPAGIAVPGASGALAGSGPFRLHKRTATSLTLRSNPDHFAGRPYLDEVVMRSFDKASSEAAAFQAGVVQISLHGPGLFSSAPRHASVEVGSQDGATLFLGVGRPDGKPYLAERELRQALLAGIDRRRLARLASAGAEAAEGPVPRRLLRTGRGAKGAFDRALSNRLLGKLANRHDAMRRDAAGGRLRLQLLLDASRSDDAIVAGQVVADLDRIGIAAVLEETPPAEYQSRLEAGRYELVLSRFVPLVPTGAAALAAAFAAGGERDEAGRCLARARVSEKDAQRFMARLPVIPLVHLPVRIHHDARLGGLEPGAVIPYADLYWQRSP